MNKSIDTPGMGRTNGMLLIALACVLGLCAVVFTAYLASVQPAAAAPQAQPVETPRTGYFPDQFDSRSITLIESQPPTF